MYEKKKHLRINSLITITQALQDAVHFLFVRVSSEYIIFFWKHN